MKYGIKFLLAVAILIFFTITTALADTVVLKNGRELEVEKTWQEGEQIGFVFHGMKVSIPQNKVIRIESDSKNQNKIVAKRVDRRPQKDVSRAQLNQRHRRHRHLDKRFLQQSSSGFCEMTVLAIWHGASRYPKWMGWRKKRSPGVSMTS